MLGVGLREGEVGGGPGASEGGKRTVRMEGWRGVTEEEVRSRCGQFGAVEEVRIGAGGRREGRVWQKGWSSSDLLCPHQRTAASKTCIR